MILKVVEPDSSLFFGGKLRQGEAHPLTVSFYERELAMSLPLPVAFVSHERRRHSRRGGTPTKAAHYGTSMPGLRVCGFHWGMSENAGGGIEEWHDMVLGLSTATGFLTEPEVGLLPSVTGGGTLGHVYCFGQGITILGTVFCHGVFVTSIGTMIAAGQILSCSIAAMICYAFFSSFI